MGRSDAASHIQRLAGLIPARGQVALWWLGQSGFLLRGPRCLIAVDPFLSEGHNREVPAAFAPETGHGIDMICCTHDHLDHLDPDTVPALAAASPEALIVVPKPVVDRVVDLGVPRSRIIGAQPGEAIERNGVTIHPVPAEHGVNVADAYNFGEDLSEGLVRYLGYIFAIDGVTIYHAGDTLVYEGQAELLRTHGVQVALLPINGRDRHREAQNLVGNMDERDAAHLAQAAGVDLLIPMHYDMFSGNLGYPGHLVDFVRQEIPVLAVLVPSQNEPFLYCALSSVRST